KARKRKIIRDPIFQKGDCIAYKLTNGNYGGAVILEAEYGTEHGLNLVAVTRLNQVEKPTVIDFGRAEILIKNFGNWDGRPEIAWIFKYKSKEVEALTEVIGNINVSRNYLEHDEKYKYGFTSGWKSVLVDGFHWQLESEKTKPRPKKTLKVKTLIGGFWNVFQ